MASPIAGTRENSHQGVSVPGIERSVLTQRRSKRGAGVRRGEGAQMAGVSGLKQASEGFSFHCPGENLHNIIPRPRTHWARTCGLGSTSLVAFCPFSSSRLVTFVTSAVDTEAGPSEWRGQPCAHTTPRSVKNRWPFKLVHTLFHLAHEYPTPGSAQQETGFALTILCSLQFRQLPFLLDRSLPCRCSGFESLASFLFPSPRWHQGGWGTSAWLVDPGSWLAFVEVLFPVLARPLSSRHRLLWLLKTQLSHS